ncbi:C-C motif chemokine 28-like [Leucoraja erinacea]|uniref:C-C motif chemokine 28-like n=1 Tax=Leucoraja erinaceus TaxID=7782 RepID=UPI002455C096|nr:C-C motif chemokine 28-like [Leucoraja erinacea]
MDTKWLALLLALSALLHTTAVTAMPTSHLISCCTQVSSKVNKRLLSKVKHFKIQDNQICDIKAVILHKGSLRLCVDSNNQQLKKWMSINTKKQLSRA